MANEQPPVVQPEVVPEREGTPPLPEDDRGEGDMAAAAAAAPLLPQLVPTPAVEEPPPVEPAPPEVSPPAPQSDAPTDSVEPMESSGVEEDGKSVAVMEGEEAPAIELDENGEPIIPPEGEAATEAPLVLNLFDSHPMLVVILFLSWGRMFMGARRRNFMPMRPIPT